MTVTITKMAIAATMGSTLANLYATPAPAPTDHNLTTEINLLAANQQALYQHIPPLLHHIAAMFFNMQPPTPRCTYPLPHTIPFHMPPIQKLTILGSPPFNAGGFNHGCGGCSTGGQGHRQGFNWCGQGQTPFADHLAARGGGFQGGGGAPNMIPQAGGFQNVNTQCMNPQYSNVTKNSTTGTCVTRVDLTSRMATHL
jgi:hypothetical protein